jgi:hypothetical protein
MMIQLIKIYIFVLSLLYILTFLFRLIIQIKSDDINIEPMNLSVFEKLLLYLSGSYVITSIITLFL